MKKTLIATSLLLLVFLLGNQTIHAEEQTAKAPQSNTITAEIQSNGKIQVKGARITSVSGSTIIATTSWNGFVMTWTVNTAPQTDFQTHFGGNANLSLFSVGDEITFRGSIVGGNASGPVVTATAVLDSSIQRRNASFIGSVTSVNSSTQSFVLSTEKRSTQTVFVSSSTKFLGQLNDFSNLTVGTKVQVSGLWNTDQNRLDASQVMIFKNPRDEARIFEGTLKSINASSTPNSIVVTVQNSDRTVTLATDVSILNSRWERTTTSSFRVGDRIRLYGIGEDTSITATVVRDISLK